MPNESDFRVLLASDAGNGVVPAVATRPTSSLTGEVTVRVAWSSINYKDALVAHGRPGLSRKYPRIPGIDAAGHVINDSTGELEPDTPVVVAGADFGVQADGGYSEIVSVPRQWLTPLPDAVSPLRAMMFGTAGFTAMMCLMRLEAANGGSPLKGCRVAVTGASGGVGSLAVALLAMNDVEVVAVSGSPDNAGLLKRIGATSMVPREEIEQHSHSPLASQDYDFAIDTVGGRTLAGLLPCIGWGGAVACVGNIGGPALKTTVFPFILRGIGLLGVDSSKVPYDWRVGIWDSVADLFNDTDLDVMLEPIIHQIDFTDLPKQLAATLEGKSRGRQVVKVPSQ